MGTYSRFSGTASAGAFIRLLLARKRRQGLEALTKSTFCFYIDDTHQAEKALSLDVALTIRSLPGTDRAKTVPLILTTQFTQPRFLTTNTF